MTEKAKKCQRYRKGRNRALGGFLLFLVALFYGITLMRFTAGS